jgi:DNA-binding transcriptional MocR family regulator
MIPCWNIEQGLGTNGLWIGAIISQSNPTLQTALTATSLLYSYVSDPSDQVTADLRQDDAFTDSYILRNRGKLSEAHQFVCQLLKKNSIEYTVGCNAGFFVWINLGRRYQEQNPMTRPAPS